MKTPMWLCWSFRKTEKEAKAEAKWLRSQKPLVKIIKTKNLIPFVICYKESSIGG